MSVFFSPVISYDRRGRPAYSLEKLIPDAAILNASQLSIETKLRLVERNYFSGRGSFFISFAGDDFLNAAGALPEGLRNARIRIERGSLTIYRGIVESAHTKENNSILELRVIDDFNIAQTKRLNFAGNESFTISTPHTLGDEFLFVSSFGYFSLTGRAFEGTENAPESTQSLLGIDGVGYHILKFIANPSQNKITIDTTPHFETSLIEQLRNRHWGLKIINRTQSNAYFYLDFADAQIEGEGADAVWVWNEVANLSTRLGATDEVQIDLGVLIDEELLALLGNFWVDEDDVAITGNNYDRYLFSDAQDFSTAHGEAVQVNSFRWQDIDYRLSFFQLIQRNAGGQPDPNLTLSLGLEPDSELLATRRLDEDNWYLRVIFNNSQHEFPFREARVSNAGTDREHWTWTLPAPISIPAQTTEKIEIANLGTFRTENNQFSTAEADRRDSNAGVQGEIITDGQVEANGKIYRLAQLWGPNPTTLYLGVDPDDEQAGQLADVPASRNWIFEITKIVEGGPNIVEDIPLSQAGVSFTGYGERWRWIFPLADGTTQHDLGQFGAAVYQVKIVRFVEGVNVQAEIFRKTFNTPTLTARRAAISILQNHLHQKVDPEFIRGVIAPPTKTISEYETSQVISESVIFDSGRIIGQYVRAAFATSTPSIRSYISGYTSDEDYLYSPPGITSPYAWPRAGAYNNPVDIPANTIGNAQTVQLQLLSVFRSWETGNIVELNIGFEPDLDTEILTFLKDNNYRFRISQVGVSNPVVYEEDFSNFVVHREGQAREHIRRFGFNAEQNALLQGIFYAPLVVPPIPNPNPIDEDWPAPYNVDYKIEILRPPIISRTINRTATYLNNLGSYYLADDPAHITSTTRIGRARGQLGRVRIADAGAFYQFSTLEDAFGMWGTRIESGDLAWNHTPYHLAIIGLGTAHTTNAGKVWFGVEPDDEGEMVNDPNFQNWELVLTNQSQGNTRHIFRLSDAVIQQNKGDRFYWEDQQEMIQGFNHNDVIKVELVSPVVNFNEGNRRGTLGTVAIERIGVSEEFAFETGQDRAEIHGTQISTDIFYYNGHLHQLSTLLIHRTSSRIDVGWEPDDEEALRANGAWRVRVGNTTNGWVVELLMSDSDYIEGTNPNERFLRWEGVDLTDEDGNALPLADGDHFSVDIIADTPAFDFPETETIIDNPDLRGLYDPTALVGGREAEGVLIYGGERFIISRIEVSNLGRDLKLFFNSAPPESAFAINNSANNHLLLKNLLTENTNRFNVRTTYDAPTRSVVWRLYTAADLTTAQSIYDFIPLGDNFSVELSVEDTRVEAITTPLTYANLKGLGNDYELSLTEFRLNEDGSTAGDILQKLLSPLNLYLFHNQTDEIEAKSNVIPIGAPTRTYSTPEIVNQNFRVEEIAEETLYTAISYNYPLKQGAVNEADQTTAQPARWEAAPLADTEAQPIVELTDSVFEQDGKKLGFIDLFEKDSYRQTIDKKALFPFLAVQPEINALAINPSAVFPPADFTGADDFRLFIQSGGPEANDNDLWVGQRDTTRDIGFREASFFGFLLRGSQPIVADGSNQIPLGRVRKLTSEDGFWLFFYDDADSDQANIQSYIDSLASALAAGTKKLFFLVEGFSPLVLDPEAADIEKISVDRLGRGNRKSIKIKHRAGADNRAAVVEAIRGIERGKLLFLTVSTKNYTL